MLAEKGLVSTEIKEYGLPFKFITGAGALESLGRYAKPLGKRAFVGAGRGSMRKAGILAEAEEALEAAGIAASVFEGIEPDPSTSTIDRAVAFARAEGCDMFVGIGGGSVLDATKAVAMMSVHEGPTKEYQMQRRQFTEPCPPVVSVVTTSGTGSEASKVSVLTNEDTGIKKAFYSFDMVSRLVILDPEITALMPRALTATTGLDALGHALEGYVSTAATPLSKGAAFRSIELVAQNLRAALADGRDLEARANMAMAAFLGGIALTGSVGTCHEMAMALGSLNKTAHGVAVAFFTVPCMRANNEHCVEDHAMVALAMGEDVWGLPKEEAALRGIQAVEKLAQDTGVPKSLSELGMAERDISEFLRISKISTNIKTNPRPMDDDLRTEILRKCLG